MSARDDAERVFSKGAAPADAPVLPSVAAARERDRLARQAIGKGESLADAEISARYGQKALDLVRKLPSKAVLEKRWPGLRINRLTHRWADDATGARGDDLASLVEYLHRPKKRRGGPV
jgi:hypothetical protein